MAVGTFNSTIDGGVTPLCSSCMVHLCWDISDEEYLERKDFWDSWICEECNNGIKYNFDYYARIKGRLK